MPAAALDIDAMTDEQRATFHAEVRSYLLQNPEVIVEAMSVLEDRQAAEQAQADVARLEENADAIFNDGHSWIGGNPEGDVTVVEFLDYRCGFCRRAAPIVEELVASDANIRLVVKEFPILGEPSERSSRFALSVKLVHGDEMYKYIHDTLLSFEGEPDERSLTRIAQQFDLDAAALMEKMDGPEVTAVIEENRRLAEALAINGTPSFIIGDQMLRGFLPIEGMREVVEEERGAL